MRKLFLIAIIFATSGTTYSQESGLHKIAESPRRWTGVAVSSDQDRIFVCYPRWGTETPISLAELRNNNIAIPYPDSRWNNWSLTLSPNNHFINIQSIHIDDKNYLWVLDNANPRFRGVIRSGPKLIKIDIRNDKIDRVYRFDRQIAPYNSYLNDFTIDNFHNHAYLTDSKLGGIITLNLRTGKAQRVLQYHVSTQAQLDSFQIDGKEWSPDAYNQGGASCGITMLPGDVYIYYRPLLSNYLYRIPARYIQSGQTISENQRNYVEVYIKPDEENAYDHWMRYNKAVSDEKVELVNVGIIDPLAIWYDRSVITGSVDQNAIRHTTSKGFLVTIAKSPAINWPDSLSVMQDGSIYFVASRSNTSLEDDQQYELWKFTP